MQVHHYLQIKLAFGGFLRRNAVERGWREGGGSRGDGEGGVGRDCSI